MAYYELPDPKKTKLGFRALESIFVGYAENSKAYRLLYLDTNVIVEFRDVEFFENKFRTDSKRDDQLPQITHTETSSDPSSSR